MAHSGSTCGPGKSVTSLEMQNAGTPLISSVIPHIDNLVQVIDDFKDNTDNHPAVHSAAIQGLTILNKYHQKSNDSFVYQIAMGKSSVNTLCMTSLTLN